MSHRRTLTEALESVLPDERTTDLLRAALLNDDVARDAWDRWAWQAGATKAALASDAKAARFLLPLLHDSMQRNRLHVDAETATYLRSAFLRESLRAETYRAIVRDLVASLEKGGVEFAVIKGAAVGETYYSSLALRHAHDVEILVRDIDAVARVLRFTAFRRMRDIWVHASGLPLRVHTNLFGESVKALDATDALSLVLVNAAFQSTRGTVRWACDAQRITASSAIQWPRLTERVVVAGAALSVRIVLPWLRENLGVDVPGSTLTALDARALNPTSRELGLATRACYAGSFRTWGKLWRQGDWALRVSLMRSLRFADFARSVRGRFASNRAASGG